MKKKIYIAGKVTGLTRFEAMKKFTALDDQLRNEGYEVVNPMLICDSNDGWETAMRKCIKALMDCDEVYFMRCWVDSRGARMERRIAIDLEIKFHKYSD